MALEIVAGALIGTALNELLGAIKDARSKISSFEPILTRLESTLVAISPKLHEIALLSKKLHHHSKHHHHSGIADLIILARDGKELVAKCSKLSPYNYVKKAQYSKMLHDLDCRLLRYFDTVLQLDQLKNTEEILLVLNELHCKLFPLDNDNDDKSRLIHEEIRSLSNLGTARWGGGGAEELENEELENEFFTVNSSLREEEDRAECSSSSLLERDNQVDDDILKRVPEVRKEDRAEDSSSSLGRWFNQVYDDILKRVPEVRKEDRTEDSSSSRERDDKVDDIIKRLLKVPVMLLEGEIRWLCIIASDIFLQQPTLLQLEPPINICGDIRGQYADLLQLFECGGFPPRSQYLFLGGYVDSDKQSLETICLLLCYKIKYPKSFFLLRGSPECEHINSTYGFYDECKRRFNVRLWKLFNECFNCLPIAALIDYKIFCMHGGLSPKLTNLDQIKNLPRPSDHIPETGLLRDLLFSDPCRDIQGWGMNDRGYSFTFGPDTVSEFLEKHDMDLICRAHQVVKDGYEFFPKTQAQLVTINSAPYYSAEYNYNGAMLIVDEFLVCSVKILPFREGGGEAKVRKEDQAENSSSSRERYDQVLDDILKRVPEVRKEYRAEDSSSSLVRDNDMYDDMQRFESFEKPLAGRGSQSSESQEEKHVFTRKKQYGTARYDYTARGGDGINLTAGEEVEIVYIMMTGSYFVKKKCPGRDGKMAGVVDAMYVSRNKLELEGISN